MIVSDSQQDSSSTTELGSFILYCDKVMEKSLRPLRRLKRFPSELIDAASFLFVFFDLCVVKFQCKRKFGGFRHVCLGDVSDLAFDTMKKTINGISLLNRKKE